ncbi:MAG TPA: LLM class flavin-dependent oxidoreductase [Abditibacteriaceae bacterium]|jgi:luciferase family oxidoreductase group 1
MKEMQPNHPMRPVQALFSVLDLSPIVQGATAAQALHNTLDLARHCEAWGYHRYWLAEHHNMTGIASAATSVVIGYVAGGTSTMRVGAGGVMLPNHAPLVIAEQFGTLESLYPGRIDLGLGRAPGTDQVTARALRRDHIRGADTFPQDVLELQSYFRGPAPDGIARGNPVRAVPGAGLNVPIWLLGSSLFSAQLAAALGLPFAFASHFAPALMQPALEIYRSRFQPSTSSEHQAIEEPYVMLGANVFAAETDAEAARLFTSLQQQFVNLQRGTPGPLPPPVDSMEWRFTTGEQAGVEQALACSFVGSPDTVRSGLKKFLANTGADELLINSPIYDHTARLRSFELAAKLRDEINAGL